MDRHTTQTPRQLSDHVVAGLEKRVTTASIPTNKLQEIYELRAIARELLGHINAIEAANERLREAAPDPFKPVGGRT